MDRRMICRWTCRATLLTVVAGVGCGQGNDSAPRPSDPAAQAAYDFLDAVLAGDTQRAQQRLTPLALARINATGKQFAPPGLETASFRIGEVRKPSESQALVQCILSDTSVEGSPRTEEIGCLMRLVDGDWRVSGIAFVPAPDRPPMILNFEHPEQGAVPTQPPMAKAGDTAAPAATRPSPRTAQEGAAAATYR